MGRLWNRSLKPAAIVLTARRKLEQRILDLGADGSARRMEMCVDSGICGLGRSLKNLDNSSTCDKPRYDKGAS